MDHAETGMVAEGPASSHFGRQMMSWAGLVVTWQAAMNFLAPMGYQDQTGFHYGERPAACLAAE